jgi:hypothetical protein
MALTDPTIRANLTALREDAAAHLDVELVMLCDAALEGDMTAFNECLAVIEAKRTCELCGEPAGPGGSICPACLEAR